MGRRTQWRYDLKIRCRYTFGAALETAGMIDLFNRTLREHSADMPEIMNRRWTSNPPQPEEQAEMARVQPQPPFAAP